MATSTLTEPVTLGRVRTYLTDIGCVATQRRHINHTRDRCPILAGGSGNEIVIVTINDLTRFENAEYLWDESLPHDHPGYELSDANRVEKILVYSAVTENLVVELCADSWPAVSAVLLAAAQQAW
ncbi:MAG: hypothetical protein AAF567_24300 [Actinomycetota bacterium]